MARRKRGRPAKDTVQTTTYLNRDTFARVEMYILDPKKGKLKHGALSALVNSLLEKFLQQVEQSDRDPVEIFRAYGVELVETDTDAT